MNTKLFFYKLLTSLRNQGMNSINVESLSEQKEFLISILNSYHFNHYAKVLSDIVDFRFFILIIFLDFELGIYDKEFDVMIFSDEPGMNQYYFDNLLLDIDDNLISELALLLKIEMDNKRQLSID